MDIKQATQKWVREFNAIPMALIERAYGDTNIDYIAEVTKISYGDRVWVNSAQSSATVIDVDRGNNLITLEIDGDSDHHVFELDESDIIREPDSFFPMWGTMWTFGEGLDDDWIEENLDIMSDLGFRIYERYDIGYVFGIDGAGYDFYEQHWIPLYRARGLKWHDSE